MTHDPKEMAARWAADSTSLNPRTQWHLLKFRIAKNSFLAGYSACEARAQEADSWKQGYEAGRAETWAKAIREVASWQVTWTPDRLMTMVSPLHIAARLEYLRDQEKQG